MLLNRKEKSLCCGCSACLNICPTNSIFFAADNEGFCYPEIDLNTCIKCGRCENVCPMTKNYHKQDKIRVFSAWNNDNNVRDNCASGGIFFTLAKKVISNSGAVIGASFTDDNRKVNHILAENQTDLLKLRKSKYLQSDLKNIFKNIKELLSQGKTVLFSGVSCQIAGLVSFLGEKPDNLILCELFCYGVPSPLVYNSYLNYIEKKYNSKIKSVDFKDKRYGWDYYTTCITLENNKKICKFGGDSYRYFMGKGYSLRPSCLNCAFGFPNTLADMILGDFYAYNQFFYDMPPKNGVSCVIIKGEQMYDLLKSLSTELCLAEIDAQKFLDIEKPKQRNFNSNKRNEFFEKLQIEGYEACLNLIEKNSFKSKIRTKIISIKKRIER